MCVKKFAGTAVVAVVLFIFCGGEGTPDYCGDGHPLNSTTQFCFGNETFDKCGGAIWNPPTQFCHDEKLYDRCEGSIYNPAERFCHENIQYPLCEGTDYNPTTHGCHFDVLRLRCGIGFYDPSFQFCYDNISYVLCEGKEFIPPNNPCGDNRYTLTTNVSPEGSGSVTRRPDQTNYEPGTEISLTATSETGYRFNGWTNAPTYVNATNANITVIISTSDLEMTANFIRRYTLTVDRNLTEGGNVRVNIGSNNPSPTIYDSGTRVTVLATPNRGYRFVNWSGASESTDSSITITINSDITLTANFIQVDTLIIDRRPRAGGSIAIKDTTTHDNGALVSVTVTAASGYEFANWTTISGTLPSSTDVTNPTISFNIDGNVIIRASFKYNNTVFGSFTDSRDNQTYRTVTMPDGKTWMAENLNFETSYGSRCYGEGGTVGDDRNNYFLSPAEIQANCETYGRLYDWATAMGFEPYCNNMSCFESYCNSTSCAAQIQTNHQGVCPSGWYLPSIDDWDALFMSINPDCLPTDIDNGRSYNCVNVETELAATTTLWTRHGSNGTDNFGFSALPGGSYSPTLATPFGGIGDRGLWWTATEAASSERNAREVAWGLGITPGENFPGSTRSHRGKRVHQSVRCIKDD